MHKEKKRILRYWNQFASEASYVVLTVAPPSKDMPQMNTGLIKYNDQNTLLNDRLATFGTSTNSDTISCSSFVSTTALTDTIPRAKPNTSLHIERKSEMRKKKIKEESKGSGKGRSKSKLGNITKAVTNKKEPKEIREKKNESRS